LIVDWTCAGHVAYGEVQSHDGHMTQVWRSIMKDDYAVENVSKIKRNKISYFWYM